AGLQRQPQALAALFEVGPPTLSPVTVQEQMISTQDVTQRRPTPVPQAMPAYVQHQLAAIGSSLPLPAPEQRSSPSLPPPANYMTTTPGYSIPPPYAQGSVPPGQMPFPRAPTPHPAPANPAASNSNSWLVIA